MNKKLEEVKYQLGQKVYFIIKEYKHICKGEIVGIYLGYKRGSYGAIYKEDIEVGYDIDDYTNDYGDCSSIIEGIPQSNIISDNPQKAREHMEVMIDKYKKEMEHNIEEMSKNLIVGDDNND